MGGPKAGSSSNMNLSSLDKESDPANLLNVQEVNKEKPVSENPVLEKKRKLRHAVVSEAGDILKNLPSITKKNSFWMPDFKVPIPKESSCSSRSIAMSIVTACILPKDVSLHEEQTSAHLFGALCRSFQQLSVSATVLEDRRIKEDATLKEAQNLHKQHGLLTAKVKKLETFLAKSEENALVFNDLINKKDEVIDKVKKEAEDSSRKIEDLKKQLEDALRTKDEIKDEIREEHIKELNKSMIMFTLEDWQATRIEYDIPDSDE